MVRLSRLVGGKKVLLERAAAKTVSGAAAAAFLVSPAPQLLTVSEKSIRFKAVALHDRVMAVVVNSARSV